MKHKAIFLDKDGTLVKDVPYNVDPRLIQFTPNTIPALNLFQKLGYKLFIVTNQSGLARGIFTLTDLEKLKKHLTLTLSSQGINLSGFYFCPHLPFGKVPQYTGLCPCRKPQPGLIFSAASEYNLDLRNSWMIGDILNDIEAGTRAGCWTALVNNGNETQWQITPHRIPTIICPDLLSAARQIRDFKVSLNFPKLL